MYTSPNLLLLIFSQSLSADYKKGFRSCVMGSNPKTRRSKSLIREDPLPCLSPPLSLSLFLSPPPVYGPSPDLFSPSQVLWLTPKWFLDSFDSCKVTMMILKWYFWAVALIYYLLCGELCGLWLDFCTFLVFGFGFMLWIISFLSLRLTLFSLSHVTGVCDTA